jgi:hypothetical protein
MSPAPAVLRSLCLGGRVFAQPRSKADLNRGDYFFGNAEADMT